MKENDWTKSICDLLQNQGLGENIYVDVLKKIPYALEISSFNEEWKADTESLDETAFETDMVVYEKVDEKIIPRVIVESKVGSVTTHDAITYSHKAMYHKNVIPFVRYGIMLGARETYPLPGRLFRHGTNFDFLFSFVDYVPSEKELTTFVDMLKREIIYSRQIEEILSNSRSRGRKRYFMLQKEFHLEEMELTTETSEKDFASNSSEVTKVTTNTVRLHIENKLSTAKKEGKKSITIIARDIHKELQLKQSYPTVCSAMKQCMGEKDIIVHTTPSGFSSTFEVEYFI